MTLVLGKREEGEKRSHPPGGLGFGLEDINLYSISSSLIQFLMTLGCPTLPKKAPKSVVEIDSINSP